MTMYAQMLQPRNTDSKDLFLKLPSDMQTYLCTGYTDLRKSIDGLCAIIEDDFGLNPFSKSMYLFCGQRVDRMKTLFFDGFAFVMMTVRTEEIRFQWPRGDREMWKLSRNRLIQLLNGEKLERENALSVFQPIAE